MKVIRIIAASAIATVLLAGCNSANLDGEGTYVGAGSSTTAGL